MDKIVRNIRAKWTWQGDLFALKGFNLAICENEKLPTEESIIQVFVDKSSYKDGYWQHTLRNLVLNNNSQYKPWVQAVYEGKDSDWVSIGGLQIADDGIATLETQGGSQEKANTALEEANSKLKDLIQGKTPFPDIDQTFISGREIKTPELTAPIIKGSTGYIAEELTIGQGSKIKLDGVSQNININNRIKIGKIGDFWGIKGNSDTEETFSIDATTGEVRMGNTNSNITFNPQTGKLILQGSMVQTPAGDQVAIVAHRGTFDETGNTTYYKNDTVTYNGSTYIYINDTPTSGNIPTNTTYWSVYASKGERGNDAPYLRVQYSVDGTSWHDTFVTGDKYIRSSNDNGSTWSSAIKIVGEDGLDGSDGEDGLTGAYTEYNFSKNTSPTVSPTTGWQSTPPALNIGEYLWMRSRNVAVGGVVGSWSTSTRISGEKGDKGDKGDTGESASLLYLTATSQVMTYDGEGNADPTSQTITFTANLQNLTGTATFTATAYNSAGSSLGSVTLGGSGNTRTMTNAQFLANSNTVRVVVQASLGGYTDAITVVKLQAGAKGDTGATGEKGETGRDAIVGFLTNESVALAADSSGVVSNFAPATGVFEIYDGLVKKTGNGVTYSLVSQTGCVVAIDATTGVYSASDLSADTGSATLRAVYNGVTIDKVFVLSKSKAGTKGDKGDKGDTGAKGAGVTFKGEFKPGIYYNNENIRDVVKYGDIYYGFNGIDGSTQTSWVPENWESFGASFASVATDLLLAQTAKVDQILEIGDSEVILDGKATGTNPIRIKAGSRGDGTYNYTLDSTGHFVARSGEFCPEGEASTILKVDADGIVGEKRDGSIDYLRLTPYNMEFKNPNTADTSVVVGYISSLRDYGIHIKEGVFDTNQAVTRQNIAIDAIGSDRIQDGSVKFNKLDTANISVPDHSNFIPFISKDTNMPQLTYDYQDFLSFSKQESELGKVTIKGSTTNSSASLEVSVLAIPSGVEVLSTLVDLSSNMNFSLELIFCFITSNTDNYSIRLRYSGASFEDKPTISKIEVAKNQRLPLVALPPEFIYKTGMSSFEETVGSGDCGSCMSGCQSSCQYVCEDSCESSCQDACQSNCQSSCEASAQGGGCWIEGSLVSVYDNATEEIYEIKVEDLKRGMLMPYYDIRTDTIKSTICIDNNAVYSKHIFVIRLDDGQEIMATGEQPIDVIRKNLITGESSTIVLPVRYLRCGDILIKPLESSLREVVSIDEKRVNNVAVYNPKTTSGKYIINGFSDPEKVLI